MPFSREVKKALMRVPGLRRPILDIEDFFHLRQHNRKHPELQWRFGPRGPEIRVESASIQIDHKLYLFGGYITIGRVCQRVDMLDLKSQRWHYLGDVPEGVPQTHHSLAHDDGHHIYMVGGQVGPDCRPATAACFVFNTEDHTWHDFPPLPAARYMPIVHYHCGRLHCMTGNLEDRKSNAEEHWSIAVQSGCATENEWRYEGRFPHPRIHTATELVGDEVIVMAGQEGDVAPIDGDPEFLCDFNSPNDIMHDEVFAYHLVTREVRELAAMPEAISHSECAVFRSGSKIIIAGGVFKRQEMGGSIYVYDITQDHWEVIGDLPHPMKSKVTACWDGRLYLVAGQRSVSSTDLRPGPVVDAVFHAELPASCVNSLS